MFTMKPAPALLATPVHRLAAALALCGALLGTLGPAQAAPPARWASGELLVGLRAGVGPAARFKLLRDHGASLVDDVGQNIRVVRIRVPVALLELVKRRLERRPEVKFVELNYLFDPALLPNDTDYPAQWHLPRIGAPQAWDLTQGAPGAVLAILDSGVEATHPDLAGKLVAGHNSYANSSDTSDAYGHGTEVAGAAGALTNNAQGVAGVAGGAPIMPVRVTDAAGRATAASIASGILWAADHGARVVNISFGAVAGNATIRSAAEYAFNHGTLVVAASGNCACVDPTPENPFILSVAATDESDSPAYFSSVGPFVDLSAPGNNILTTARFGLYTTDSGTSLASPVVAGVAALMFAANPALTPALAVQMLEATVVDPGGNGYDQSLGYGRVNAAAAVGFAASYVAPPDTVAPQVSMLAPLAGASLAGTAVVDVAASDDVGVAKVDLFLDGAFFVSDSSSPYSFALDTTALANGSHVIEVVASDAAHNSASSGPLAVTVNNAAADTTPPVLSISAPAAGATLSGTVSVSASATDDVGVGKVDLLVDGVLYASDSAAPWAFSWNTALLANGSHSLRLVATDAAGNAGEATRAVTVFNNHAPVAAADAFGAPYRAKASYTAQVLAVLANDSDADGNLNPASVKIVSAPNKGGTVKVNANGTLSYTPKQGWRGVETFSYNVKDSAAALSNTASVSVNVQ
jgi:subtilisin family serine protease